MIRPDMVIPPQTTEADVYVHIEWRPAGPVTLDAAAKLRFPTLPALPGLYEIEIGGDSPSVYIGESDDLRRRMGHYRNPGPTQQTNIRLSNLIKSHVLAAPVSMSIATTVTVTWASEHTETLDLQGKTARLVGESVWLLHRQRHGTKIENAAEKAT